MLMEGVVEDDDTLPVKDIEDAIETELSKLQYSRRLHATATRNELSSVEHSGKHAAKITHIEL